MAGSKLDSVTLAGEEVSQILMANDTYVVVVAAANGSITDGAVGLVADTGAFASGGSWTYLTVGVVNAVTPASGQGGTIVVITGERLMQGGTSVVGVSLGGKPVTKIHLSLIHI